MALVDSDLVTAVNAAGPTATAQNLQDAFSIAFAFAAALEAAATQSGQTVAQLATAFAQRSILQMQAVALEAQIANAEAARDTATTTANTTIGTLQTQLNAVNAQLQQTVQS